MKTKSFTLIAIALLLCLTNCGSKKSAESPTASSLSALADTTALSTEHSHKVTLDEAAVYISDFVRMPAIANLAGYTLGGTYPVRHLKIAPDSVGIIFWFCFKPKAKEIFPAVEQLKNLDTSNLPKQPSGKWLIRPDAPFKNIMGSSNSAAAVKSFLNNHSVTLNTASKIESKSVMQYVQSFDSLLATMPDNNKEKYNKYPLSIFMENSKKEFDHFLSRAGKNGYIRYYLGYDENEKPNRIRVILIAADSLGRNITTLKNANDAVLQKSVPPPPVQ
jgi:hypothetical protein